MKQNICYLSVIKPDFNNRYICWN